MFNLLRFCPLILIFSLSISADYAYTIKGCNLSEAQEFFDVSLDTRKKTLSITNIYGSGTDEDSQLLTFFNPFKITKIDDRRIFAESRLSRAIEPTGITSGSYYEGADKVSFAMLIDLDAKSAVLSVKIEDIYNQNDIEKVKPVLREFGFSTLRIYSGAVVDGPYLYTGCGINITKDYLDEERKEKEEREKREIEKQLIELEMIKAEAELRKQKEYQAEPSFLSTGTGFIINDEGYIVTNYHVIANCEYIKYGNENLEKVASDPYNDISVLKSNRKVSNKIDLSPNSVIKGEDIFVIGYPFGTELSGGLKTQSKTTKGIVSSLQGPENFYTWFQMDAAIQPGNSGGPIIDEKGGLKGVTVATEDAKKFFEEKDMLIQNINYGIKVDIVKNILDANEINYDIKEESFFDFLFAETTEEVIKNADKSTLYLECWGWDMPQE